LDTREAEASTWKRPWPFRKRLGRAPFVGAEPINVTMKDTLSGELADACTLFDTVTRPREGKSLSAAATKSAESQGESATVVSRAIAVRLESEPEVGSVATAQSETDASETT
jgi:hypothetical protein